MSFLHNEIEVVLLLLLLLSSKTLKGNFVFVGMKSKEFNEI